MILQVVFLKKQSYNQNIREKIQPIILEVFMKCRNYAHRGFSGCYPENTMLSFEKAVEAGCEGIELDVHLTKDNQLVIIHDEKIDRTSNQHGFVKDMTYEELCRVDFSYKYTNQFGFQKIPTLREYFEFIKEKDLITNIELKTGVYEYPGIEKAVYEMICAYNLQNKVIISSFNHNSVMRMKTIAPELECGFLTETWLLDAGSYVSSHKIEAYHPDFHMLTDSELTDLKKHHVKINTWTVNETEDILSMIQKEVDGIISNYPDRVAFLLKQANLR